jgi:hypothetical protein
MILATASHTAGAHLPTALAPYADGARWASVAAHWTPVTTCVHDGDVVVGAALTTGRPGAAYRKVVDIAAESDDTFASVLAAVQRLRQEPVVDGAEPDEVLAAVLPPVVVHVEEHTARPFTDARTVLLGAAGFVLQPQPLPSVPSTIADDPAGVRVWTWWAGETPLRAIPYYGQTTDVTCGAVTALDAIHTLTRTGFTADRTDNHAIELGFWRQATNLPACEPIGLAVASREALGDAVPGPRVVLSAIGPVLLEEYLTKEWELRLREDLQAEARRRAAQLDVPIDHRWIEVDEIADLVRAGNLVGILIDLMPLIQDPSPHWILAYDVVGENILVSDPWVESDHGESWADTFALPLSAEMLDRIARWGDPVYRGIVVFPNEG